ncbi:MAG: hypothetical protein ACLVJ6_00920 [Merdibacter sp.]
MFQYYQPTRIHFGAGKLDQLGDICKRYGTRSDGHHTGCSAAAAAYARVKQIAERRDRSDPL